MSQKSKHNRAVREKKQQLQGQKVIYWIIGILIVMAFAVVAAFASM